MLRNAPLLAQLKRIRDLAEDLSRDLKRRSNRTIGTPAACALADAIKDEVEAAIIHSTKRSKA
jgi:hypothetical protein